MSNKADLSRPRIHQLETERPESSLLPWLPTTMLLRMAQRGFLPAIPAPRLWRNYDCCQKSTKLLIWKLPLAVPGVRALTEIQGKLMLPDLAIITLQEVRRLSGALWGHKAVQEPCKLNHYYAWRHSASVLHLWGCSFQQQHLCRSCFLYRNT